MPEKKLDPKVLAHMTHADPARAARIVLAALRLARAHKSNAAESLGITIKTFIAWEARLGITAAVEAMIAQAREKGWWDSGNRGRPRLGAEKSRAAAGERPRRGARPRRQI